MGGTYLICTGPAAGRLLPGRWASRRRWVLALLLAGGVAALMLAPPALLLVDQQRTAPADLLVEEEEATMQTDLLAYLTPSGSHPVLGPLTWPAYESYYPDRGGTRRFPAYVGVSVLVLLLLGVGKVRRAALPWLAMALVLLLLALGPVLRIGGRLYPAIPMPYRLAARLFVPAGGSHPVRVSDHTCFP
jgi:MFS family permease